MQIRVDIRTMSVKFIFLIGLMYMLDLITMGRLSEIFTLDIAKVSTMSEYWRLITYPLAFGSFSSLALFLFTFILFVPLLEKINSKLVLAGLAVLAVVSQSSILMLFNAETVISQIGGMAGLSWFMLSLMIFTYPGSEIVILGKRIKSWMIVLGLVLLYSIFNLSTFWLSWTAYPLAQHLVLSIGIVLGFLSSFVLKYISARYITVYEEEFSDTMYDDFSPAMVEEEEEMFNTSSSQQNRGLQFSSDFEKNEITLNSILDKINAHGKDSLTPDEIQFLKDFKS